MGSSSRYSTPAQMRFVVQWFSEWSEMQRNDFLLELAQKIIPNGYVNGLVAGMDGVAVKEDRPPSLFQCRIKLFREWADNWNESEKQEVLSKIKALDANFASKFDEELQSVSQSSEQPSQPVAEGGETL
ncbi:uncharacterized protein C14orf119 [Schistocerca americana]|uniref:uncharacterized protein C14orf119 n=1 Tax=Schistocerca americana TaxID=7009 RepID=UPI001F4F7598|nr:uncharacterized protein C14orf119 [Schistocerca americana]XP_049845775.1 uncharacterized protein C14orf119 [Schistocerca gregaria]XP_049954526.1 uncharacterized protein C14orf119 [Schistocerca serialis cubense]